MSRIKRLFSGGGVASLASSLIAILVGLLFGLVIMLISNPGQALQGIGIIAAGGFTGGMKGIGQVLYYATPLIMTGLSVGFAFRTGLFNIGAPGQLMVGGLAAIYCAAKLEALPAPVVILLSMLAAMVMGGLWGAIPGFFKAKLNVNEVIACIMCNYIGMYGVKILIKNTILYDSMKTQSISVGHAAIPKAGLDAIFFDMKGSYKDVSSVNAGIIIAILFAILIYFILNKTTFGYELKACGHNREASRYAGINEKRSILLSMIIAGMLAGMAGALMYLAPAGGLHMRAEEILSPQGFSGIPVALLGLTHPIGIIFSGIFIAYLSQGGYYLQKLNFMPEIIDIIISAIIYFSAFSLLVKGAILSLIKRRAIRGTQNRREEKSHE